MTPLQIIGRRSSLFTRVVLIFAEELGAAYQLVPIYDMTTLSPDVYAGNPALKLPILRRGDAVLFGTLNICRALAETAAPRTPDIVWPEDLRDDLSRNAQELVWHCMAAQVQLVMGTLVGKLPADNVFFVKTRTGILNALDWLEANLASCLAALPASRSMSMFETSLFCLLEHLTWRPTMPLEPRAQLDAFVREFASRPAARRTAYAFDSPA